MFFFSKILLEILLGFLIKILEAIFKAILSEIVQIPWGIGMPLEITPVTLSEF